MKAGAPARVVGRWTMQTLNLELLDDQGHVLHSKCGPGLGQLSGSVQDALSSALADWEQRFGRLPIVLAGLPVSFLQGAECCLCPVELKSLPAQIKRFSIGGRSVFVVPGLKCISRTGNTDFLWGEETQLFGALALHPDLGRGSKTICIPGALTRWIVMRQGCVLHFVTSISGELYRLISNNDFLSSGARPGEVHPEIFLKGLKRTQDQETVDLMYLLFQGRSHCLEREMAPADVPSFLLGLVIGRDVAGADDLLKFDRRSSLVLIADGTEQYLYKKAFEAQGFSVSVIDGSRAIDTGLALIAKTLDTDARLALAAQ